MLEISRSRLAILWKKPCRKVHCISARLEMPMYLMILMTTLEPVKLRANKRSILTHSVSLKIVRATLAERALLQYSPANIINSTQF